MDATPTDGTVLTERQAHVMRLRADGLTQQEVATRLGTTASNVSAVERAGQDNVERARRTLDLARAIRAPTRVTAPPGTVFDDLVDAVYAEGDETGTKVDFCRPELYAHLYTHLDDALDGGRIVTTVEIGLTREGDVRIYTDESDRSE